MTELGADRENVAQQATLRRLVSLIESWNGMHSSQAHNPELPPITLIGAGRVGGSLQAALAGPGRDVRLARRGELDAALAGAEIALLCVPDESIGAACEEIAARRETSGSALKMIGHTSGASTLDALALAETVEIERFSIHPLQTIPSPATVLTGAPAAVAGGSPDALACARTLASAAGLHPFEVPESERAAYHAAASMASNFLIALEESAAELLSRAGVADSRELLAPLVLRTAANWADRGGEALTGPIARGDEETVERHRQAVADLDPALSDLYEALATRTREIAGQRATITTEHGS